MQDFPEFLPEDQRSESTDAGITFKKAVPETLCPWAVPKMSASEMPNPDIFNIDSSDLKDHFDSTSDEKEKQQKFAFTEIWVDTQQILPKSGNHSPLKDFNNALEEYFNEDEPLNHEDVIASKTESQASSVDDVFYTPKVRIY